MSSARYVGRVGALAVALGIGAVIAGVPGVAWADTEGEPDPSDAPGVSAPGNLDSSAGDPSDTEVVGGDEAGDAGEGGDSGDVDGTDDSEGGMRVGNSGGPITSTSPGSAGAKSKKDDDADAPKKRSTVKQKVVSVAPSPTTTTMMQSTVKTVADPVRQARSQSPALSIASPKDPDPQLNQSTSPPLDVAPLTLAAPGLQKPVAARMTAVTKPLAQSAVLRLLPFVTLAPTADGKQGTTESPLWLGFLAAGREVDKKASTEDESIARTVDSAETSLMMTLAAAVNSAPTVGVPNEGAGAVTGFLNGHTVTSQPTNGTVTVTGDTYTYTPTAPARLRAALTTQPDYDSFAVSMSGQPAGTVTVPILPAVLSNQSSIPVAGQPALATPTGIAINGTYAYVTNQAASGTTVSVINIATGAVVKTITVGSQPSAVAISPTAKRAYVTNWASGTVTVINTDTNTVVGSAIRVGTAPQDVAVNSAGTQVFVANNGSSSVSVIEPALNNRVTNISLGFGNSAPTAIALSADGTRAYVTHRTITGGGAVSIINTSTKKVISTVAVGSSPQDVAVAGSKVYVANYNGSSVSVINTAANNSVTTLNVGSKPTSLAVSPDGSMMVIARDDDNISIIDTKTTTVIGAQHVLDTTTPLGGHVVAFDSNGRILITDAADHTVRVVGLARGNTAPIATADPTVDTIDSIGVVTGALNIDDPDGDSLTFTASGLPAATGSVTVDSTGMYTFTPSEAARDQAAQPGGPTTVSFTVHAEDRFHAFKDATVTVPIEPKTSTGPLTGEITATTTQIPLGAWPDFLAANGSRVYVLNAGESTVSVIDTNTNTVIDTSDQLSAGGAMVLSPDGKLYVAEYVGSRVLVLDAATLEQVDTINVTTTYGGTLAVSQNGKYLYVGSTTYDQVPYYDEYGNPYYDEYGNPYYSYANPKGSVSVVDTTTKSVIASIPIGPSIGNVELSPDGKLLYANAPDRVHVIAIDAATNTYVTSFGVGGQPADVAFSPDSKRAYITNLQSGELYVIDTTTNTVIAKPIIDSIDYRYFPEWDYEHEAGFPTDLEVSKDGQRLYIARGDDIVVVDTVTYSVIQELRLATNIPNEGAQSLTITDDGTIYVTLEDTVVAVEVTEPPAYANLALSEPDSGARMMFMAAAVNSAPTAAPSTSTPNQATGQITGNVNAADVDGNTLTYTVPASGAGAPVKGTVSINKDTGVFTYQPSAGARLAAQSTSTPDFDTFTVDVNDGQVSTPVTVSVAVLPAVTTLAVTDTLTLGSGSNPSAVATYGNRTYVANATARTVKVINTDTNQVIATVAVQTSPTAIAVSPDGKSVWVANSGSRTVQRIDTQSNTVVATVTVGTTPTALAVNGDSVWVANAGSGSVSRISMATNTVVATTTVGSAPSALAVSGDKVYVANKNSNSISVISTDTNKVVQTKSSVTGPTGLAVSGGKLYVTQQGFNLNRVLVLNSSTLAQIATINMAAAPTSVAVIPDGTQAYVTMTNHRVSVINTQTNAVVSTTVVNSASGTGGHIVAVDGSGTNGKVYISDAVDNSVRVLSLARGNTALVSTANPSIVTVDTGRGVVTGSLNVKDWDGDTVTYAVTSQPTSATVGVTPTGTVTVDAAGIYTYEANQAARDLAAQTSGADTTTFVVTANDGRGSTRAETVTVPISPLALSPNQAPVATTPVLNSRNTTTGVVTGSWKVTDADGDPLTYTVTGPARGTVEITRQGDTYSYAYTPSQAERFAALNTAQADYDQFAVIVSDGRASTTVNVPVPVLPSNIGDTAFVTYLPAGTDPGGVTVVGDRAYVLNPGNNTVTIMTAGQYPNVIATIPVSTTPTAVAVNSQYRRAYIGGSSAVTLINTDDNTKVTTVATGGGQVYGIAVSPDGSKVYVTNSTAGTVSVINPANNTVVGTIQVGSSPAGVTFTPDGRFAYVANMGTNTVTVINAATNTPLASPIVVGTNPANIAVSPDGKWAYVTNYASNTVSYIDTATNTVVGAPLSVAEKPYGIFTSPDGSILYVASATGTAMYDAKTRRWISHIWSGDNNTRRTSAVYRDGLFVYTTNTTEDLLRTTSIIRGNTAPIATGSPTVGTPDPVLGAVSGSLNIDDPDGDWLTYRVSGPLTAGTVSFNGAGGYAFTPTQAARDAAALTQGADYATFTVTASDWSYPVSPSNVDVTVTVPIAPSGAAIPTTTTAINVGSPGKVVISNGRAYVYNSSNRTIAVIDPATNHVTATIPVPAANDFVVRNDGRIYVMGYDTVSVVNPDGTQAVPPVRIPDLCETEGCWGSSGGLTDIAINPAGTSVYVVRQYYIDTGTFSTVSMIDTANNTVVNTVSTYPLSDIEVTPDGTRLYAAENDYRVVPVLSAINLSSAGGVGVTAPGEWPYVTNVSISPDGKRTYALVGGTAWAYDPTVAISVIDSDPTSSTYNTQIATIALPGATDVAFSPDSRRAYILMNDGKTVRVVDTATSTVVGYFTVPGANSIAVASNGTVYLTNAAAGTVYAVMVGGTTSPL